MTDIAFPFVARGQPGEILVTYSVNGDPDRWGFDILGLEGDVSRAATFPVFEADVKYARDGYAAFFGWVQVVHYWSADSDRPLRSLVDAPPQLRGLGVPFFGWGREPRFFDAPLDTPEGIVRWQAMTFLTQTPDGLLSRVVHPLVGVTWGYSIDDEVPTMIPVTPIGLKEWIDVMGLLESECPTWTFGNEFPARV